jgi:hypothetical protein
MSSAHAAASRRRFEARRRRALCYLASCLVLAAMWIAFAIDIARA